MSPRLAACLAAFFAATSALAIAAGPAFAERVYESKIEGFSDPNGVAIDGQGDVWISDPGNQGLISKFDPYPSTVREGEQSGGGNYGNGGGLIYGLAIGDLDNDLYVAEDSNGSIDVFESGTGPLVEQWGGLTGYPLTIAIDNSGEPSNGTVYVAGGGTIKAFEPDHNLALFSATEPYIKANTLTGTPNGPFGEITNIAVDNHGDLYVVDQSNRVVDEFNSSGVFIRAFGEAGLPHNFGEGTAPGSRDALTGVAVDPTDGHVLVVDSSNDVIDEFDSMGKFLGEITGPEAVEGETFQNMGGGIAVNAEGYIYVSEGWQYFQHGGNGVVDIFSPDTIRPKVTYEEVTSRTPTGGILNATVNLNGSPAITSCTFQYGPTSTYGASLPCSPESTPYTGPTKVSAQLSGLMTEETYHYRVVLNSSDGIKRGADRTYTPHAVAGLTTDPASELTRASATINGAFIGNGEATHYYFEWGTSDTYGNATEVKSAGSPGASENVAEAVELTGLTAETIYHFRFVAENALGITRGPEQSFATFGHVEGLSTGVPTHLTAVSATLGGAFSGNGEATRYYFEWGPTEAYGNTTQVEDAGSPPAHESISKTINLAGLEIDSTYHYRFVAENAAGITKGADRSFTTLGRYEFSTDFGSAGSGVDQFESPEDVAVDDSTGDVYVADTGNYRIVKLTSSGEFLTMFGQDVDETTGGSVCPENPGDICRAGKAGSAPDQFQTARYVAVDNSTGPSAGDVYVADTGDDLVQKFDPEGHLVTNWGIGGVKEFNAGVAGIAVASDGELIVRSGKGSGIAVDALGDVHLGQVAIDPATNYLYTDTGTEIERSTSPASCSTEAEDCPAIELVGNGDLSSGAGLAFYPKRESLYVANSGDNDVAVFAPRPLPRVVTGPSLPATSTTTSVTGKVEPTEGEEVTGCQFEFGREAGNYDSGVAACEPTTHFAQVESVHANLSNLAPGVAYHYRLVATDAGGQGIPRFGSDRTFVATEGMTPSLRSTKSSSVTPTTAVLSAEIDPNLEPTTFRFEYGITDAYGAKTLQSESLGEDGAEHTVSTELSGLSPGTTYHFRAVGVNFTGPAFGPDQTFNTTDHPIVAATGASSIGRTTATLSALIQPGFSPTTYRFEYGTTSAYGVATSISGSLPPDNSAHAVNAVISTLQPETTYHYRVIATNAVGTTYGPDQTFATEPSTTTAVMPRKPCKKELIRKGTACVKKHHRIPHQGRKRHKRNHS